MTAGATIPGPGVAERFRELTPPLAPAAAQAEALRCLHCHAAPCTAACPTHIDVAGFIGRIAHDNLRGAALTILDANILGASCARVCPVEVLCEGACVYNLEAQPPIQIGRLQRHATDWFFARGLTPPPRPGPPPPHPLHVACVGAGPASLACAAELARRGHAAVVFDRQTRAGGLNAHGVAEYKLGTATAQREVEMIAALGVAFELGIEAEPERLEREFDFIFLGVGLGAGHRLGVPGDHLPGVVDALSFIGAYKREQPIAARQVVVIGGGNTAIDAARAALRLGAERVHLAYRRGRESMSAFASEYEHALQEGVEFHWHSHPARIHGARGRVAAVAFTDDPRPEWQIPCDLAIVAIGQSRLLEFLARCRDVRVEAGRIWVDRATGATSNPRYFAGGDCVNGGREVVDAVADGQRAAAAIAQRTPAAREAARG